jgi:hypothetical protein
VRRATAPSLRATTLRWAGSVCLVAAVSCVGRESTVAPSDRETSGSEAAATGTETTRVALAPLPLLTSEELALDEQVDVSELLPDAPSEPAPSPSTDPEAAAFAAIVERSAGCYLSPELDRHRHLPPADCASLFAQLEAGGDPASSAIGGYLAENAERLDQDVVTRLSLVLASNPRLGVSFLVRRLHQLAAHDEVLARNGVLSRTSPNEFLVRSRLTSMFELATGYPIDFYAGESTRDELVAHDRVVAIRALRFWHRHESDPASWPRLAEQRVRSWLAADERRMVSAARLVRDRPAYGAMVPLVREVLGRVALHNTEAQVILEDLERLDDSGEGSLSGPF